MPLVILNFPMMISAFALHLHLQVSVRGFAFATKMFGFMSVLTAYILTEFCVPKVPVRVLIDSCIHRQVALPTVHHSSPSPTVFRRIPNPTCM